VRVQPTSFELTLQRAAAVSSWIQGEVLAAPDACVILAEASAPLSEESAQIAAETGTGLIVVPNSVDNVVLLTQTCDLQFTTEDEFTCLVAPVVDVTETMAHEAWRGRRPRLTGLPWVSSTAVADLSRITTVERSVLIDVASLGRPRTLKEQLQFAETIGRYLMRPALPDQVNDVLKPFVKHLSDKHDKNSPEGFCVHKVAELRVEATPEIDSENPALNVLMILDEEDLPSLPNGADVDDTRIDTIRNTGLNKAVEAVRTAIGPIEKREAWTALAECWIKPSIELAHDITGVAGVEISVMNGEEFSYARSLNAPRLDLRYLTTRAA
jgi:hypothetical protein